jgi:hypothetical protein
VVTGVLPNMVRVEGTPRSHARGLIHRFRRHLNYYLFLALFLASVLPVGVGMLTLRNMVSTTVQK